MNDEEGKREEMNSENVPEKEKDMKTKEARARKC